MLLISFAVINATVLDNSSFALRVGPLAALSLSVSLSV